MNVRCNETCLVSDCFEFTDELDGEDDPDTLDEAEDDGYGADEDEMVAGEAGELDGAASVVNIAGVVPHPATPRHALTARVGDLNTHTLSHYHIITLSQSNRSAKMILMKESVK